MKEILIINLTRMGDLLQTTPLMAGLREKNPDVKITLAINSAFTEICRGIPFIDDLIAFDMHGFRDRIVRKKYSLVENYRLLDGLINRINEKEYDLAINLTHSPISALITSLIKAKEIRGFSVDREGNRLIKHPWLRYFFNVVPNRDYNPFHLVDMYLKSSDSAPVAKKLVYAIPDGDERKADDLLRQEGVADGEMLIGIHLGASKSDRRWPVRHFAALADMIARSFGAKIALIGSGSESGLASEFNEYSSTRAADFTGRTALGELAAILKRCSLLIGNDTGPLHLATAVGTRVVGIFSVNAHYTETGPYGEGHYVIEADLPCVPCGFDVQCNNMICREVITPELVFRLLKGIMHEKTAPADSFLTRDKVQIYRTYFKEDGMLGFYPLVKKPIKKKALYRILYREIWNRDPDKTNGKIDRAYNNACGELAAFNLPDDVEEMVVSLGKDLKALHHIKDLAERGAEIVKLIREEAERDDLDINRLKELSSRLEAVDNDIEKEGHANPCLRPLTVVFAFSREALEGSGLSELAEDSGRIYGELLYRISSLLLLLKKVLTFIQSGADIKEEPKTATIHDAACRTACSGNHI